MAKTGWRKFG